MTYTADRSVHRGDTGQALTDSWQSSPHGACPGSTVDAHFAIIWVRTFTRSFLVARMPSISLSLLPSYSIPTQPR